MKQENIKTMTYCPQDRNRKTENYFIETQTNKFTDRKTGRQEKNKKNCILTKTIVNAKKRKI